MTADAPDTPGMPGTRSAPARAAVPDDLPRFARANRAVHWATAILFGACLLTALALYVGPIAALVGRRALVAAVHTYCGLALPLPALVGLVARSVREDVASLDRFGVDDWEWFRSSDRRTGRLAIGKFNPGQKLNASLTCGGIVVMLASGFIMWQSGPWPVQYRTGATFVHDWVSLALVILLLGHVRFALGDPESRRGMWHGVVARQWARREHRAWHDALTGSRRDR